MAPLLSYQRGKNVEFIDHDYRRKHRVIERIGDMEFVGGIAGTKKRSAGTR